MSALVLVADLSGSGHDDADEFAAFVRSLITPHASPWLHLRRSRHCLLLTKECAPPQLDNVQTAFGEFVSSWLVCPERDRMLRPDVLEVSVIAAKHGEVTVVCGALVPLAASGEEREHADTDSCSVPADRSSKAEHHPS